MGIRTDTNDQPRSGAQFPTESVLGRMERGGYNPTDEDLADLEKLAETGNRAERRAAGKYLKKHGIAVPEASPRQPIVAPADDAPAAERPAQKPAVKKTAVEKDAPKKTPAKKAAAKKTAAKKAPAKKAPAKKTAVKKTTARKTPVKKTPARKSPARKTPRKK